MEAGRDADPWFGFTLMPHNFFATNPAMTIRDVK